MRIGAICVWERRKDALKCLFPKYCGQIPYSKKRPLVFGLLVFLPEIRPISGIQHYFSQQNNVDQNISFEKITLKATENIYTVFS